MLALIERISLTDLILVLGLAGVAITRIGEGRGWFRSAAGLRTENTDLIRRNHDLEQSVARIDFDLSAANKKILMLERSIRDLEKLDQSAVLQALKDHETGAIGRAERTHELQTETNAALDKIVVVLETTTKETHE